MKILQWSLWTVGLLLQFLVFSALLRGVYRKYPFLFAYSITLFLTTVIEVVAALDVGFFSGPWAGYYWVGDLVRQAALHALALSLIYTALPADPKRAARLRLLLLASVIYWALSAYFCFEPRLNLWMTRLARNLTFGVALLNLLLWSLLIARRTRDRELLLISGGLGIQMAGEAVGLSLRGMSRAVTFVGVLISIFAHFLCLLIWWRALRGVVYPERRQPA